MTMTKEKTTVAVARIPKSDERSPERRIELVRSYLDRMEAVQLQHAAGAILIGLELLAIKDQLGRGEFLAVFEQQIERPRFSLRSAQRYMSDAAHIRRKMLKGGSMDLVAVLNIAPSALDIGSQRKLQGVISAAVGDRTLTGLRHALGGDKPKLLTDGKPPAPGAGKAAEAQAHAAVWDELVRRLTQESLSRKSWKFLTVEHRKVVREMIHQAWKEIPE